jgi:hypothetical protein
MTPLAKVIEQAEKLSLHPRRRGREYIMHCPAHDDSTPSLGIAEKNGKVLIRCHADCDAEAVVAALGLTWSDFFAEGKPSRKPRIVAEYDYLDAAGKLLFQVVRFEGKVFRQRRPDGAGGWVWNLGRVPRVPYRLPELLKAKAAGELIWIAEGEKDVHALERAGRVATTDPGGAGKWRPEYAEHFRGARVRIVADADEPGRAHAQAVAASLNGIAAEVELLEPAAGKDAADHLAAGRSIGEFRPVELNETARLLDDVQAFVQQFVVFQNKHQAVAGALWTLHTHAIDAADTTPYLWVSSPEKRSGKTRYFDVLELLVRRPWRLVTPTEAVVFRKIEHDQPTLLLDEVDTVFAGDNAEGLRGILNAGHTRGAKVDRISERGRQLESFAVYGAKAFAGIRKLPDTIIDRSIPMRLHRKTPSESVRKFRIRYAREEAEPIRDRLEKWAEKNLDALREARPEIPEGLNDRAADGWEPPFAIADLAGERWGKLAREAALALHGAEEDESWGIRLLADIRQVFDDESADRLASADLAARLCELEESPWGDLGGKRLDARGLARRLKPFGIHPRKIRFESPLQGYGAADFEDAWNRYLPPFPPEPDPERNNGTSQVDAQIQPEQTEAVFRTKTVSDQESSGVPDKRGDRDGTLRENLAASGYSEDEIDYALEVVEATEPEDEWDCAVEAIERRRLQLQREAMPEGDNAEIDRRPPSLIALDEATNKVRAANPSLYRR